MWHRLLTFLQVDRTFMLLVFLFSYFLVISNRVRAGMLSWYTFTPEGPLIEFCSALLIFTLLRFWLSRQQRLGELQQKWQQYLRIFFITLGCYLAFNNGIGLLFAMIFDTFDRNFNVNTLLLSNLSQIIDIVLYSGIYLAYQHSQQAAQYRQQLAEYHQQLAQLKIQQLKAQLNPHFVFNSLNTLDELISVAPEQASQYLHDFAELYRLSIHNTEQQLVPLSQELQFAKHYFQLMQTRLGAGYQLQIDTIANAAQFFLPPFTLQLLIENAFLHNRGSVTEPLWISIKLQQNGLQVCNTFRPKKHISASNGISLQNLSKQFLFLAGSNIEITRNVHNFAVYLPLIRENNHVSAINY